ncbi:MAG: hypothetical protein J0M19_01995, partial [Sphingomonadales bacterium]|nr:hypothetical protein [Sphingomonadales bacterium]
MAKQSRKPANPKPITAHPLFPAVVALWFGALFGLGSLAVRPSLLESLVIKSRLDLVLPAAAPPLGVTARILVALILAAIGSIIGIMIARKLSRPKVEMRERKRKTLASADGDVAVRRRDTHPDAPARRPISASDELAEEPGTFGGGVLAARRRSLAIEHEDQAFVPHESAPLPGGVPQVFDVRSVGMNTTQDDAPLELGTYAESAPTPLGDLAADPLPQTMARQVFQPHASSETIRDHYAGSTDAVEAAEAGQQIFGVNPQPHLPDSERQIFGQPIQGDHVSQDFVKAAGFRTTVFETPESTPLFGPRDAAPDAAAAEPFPPVAPEPLPTVAVPADLSQQGDANPIATTAIDPQPEIAQAGPPTPGIEDLASRLAESMARRRA